MTGLGIIDTDLCLWASTATPEMVDEAWMVPGHPVVKAKPAPYVPEIQPMDTGLIGGFNCWVERHPIWASVLLAGGYLLLRRSK